MSCFVCDKHLTGEPMPGGPVGADELVVVSHIEPESPGRDGGPVYLGHLVVEPRRHVSGMADLTDREAEAIGRWCARASRALRATGAEHVYLAVIGHTVDHLHVHLLPRYPGTPREYWWERVDEWPDAARGGVPEIARLVGELREHLEEPTTSVAGSG